MSHSSFPPDKSPDQPPARAARLRAKEVQAAFAPLSAQYPPILFLGQAAQLAGYTPATLKKKVSEGCFRDSVARGKPLRFWRDQFVLELMNKPASSRPSRSKATRGSKGLGNETA